RLQCADTVTDMPKSVSANFTLAVSLPGGPASTHPTSRVASPHAASPRVGSLLFIPAPLTPFDRFWSGASCRLCAPRRLCARLIQSAVKTYGLLTPIPPASTRGRATRPQRDAVPPSAAT